MSEPRPPFRPSFWTTRGALYVCDCLVLLRKLKDDSVDCVFADPPFNLRKDYGDAFRDDLDAQQYLKWCSQWLAECARVLAPGGAIFIYSLPRWGYHIAAQLEELGLTFRHWIALSMKATFPRGQRLYPAHYALLYFTNGKPKTFNRLRVPVPACRHCGKDYLTRDPFRIRVPVVTRKERLLLDGSMPCPEGWIPKEIELSGVDVAAYRSVYQFLPAYAELLL